MARPEREDVMESWQLFATLGTTLAAWGTLVALMWRMHTSIMKGMEALRTEVKGDIEALRTELKGEIEALRTELKGEIQGLRTELKGRHRRPARRIGNPADGALREDREQRDCAWSVEGGPR